MSLLSSPLYIQKSIEKAGFSGKREDKNGRTICYQNGKRVPCNALGGKKKPPAKRPEKKPVEDTVKEIKGLVESGQGTPAKLLEMVKAHTVAELKKIQAELGLKIKGNPRKAERANKLAEAALALSKPKSEDQGTTAADYEALPPEEQQALDAKEAAEAAAEAQKKPIEPDPELIEFPEVSAEEYEAMSPEEQQALDKKIQQIAAANAAAKHPIKKPPPKKGPLASLMDWWNGKSLLYNSPLYVEKAGFTGRRDDKNGRTICYRNGTRVPCSSLGGKKPPAKKPAAKKPPMKKPPKKSVESTISDIKGLVESGQATSAKLLEMVKSHTVADLKTIQSKLGLAVKGNPLKSERAKKIASEAAKLVSKKPPTQVKPPAPLPTPEPNKPDAVKPPDKPKPPEEKPVEPEKPKPPTAKSVADIQKDYLASVRQDESIVNEFFTVKGQEKTLFKEALSGDGKKALEWSKASQRLKELQPKARAAKDRIREKFLEKFKVATPSKVNMDVPWGADQELKDRAELAGITKYDPSTPEEVKAMKTCTDFLSNLTNGMEMACTTIKLGDRASYMDGSSQLKLGPTVNVGGSALKPGVLIHEMGHHIEEAKKGAKEKVLAFLEKRVGGEKEQDLTAFGMPGEKGRKDNFDKVFDMASAYYIGKVYPDGGTEVLSMGIQKLYEDPATFIKRDPEFAQLIIDILRS